MPTGIPPPHPSPSVFADRGVFPDEMPPLLVDVEILGKLPPADPLAVLHRSLSAWWWLLELWPKPYVDTATQPPRRSLQLHLGRRRPVPENAEIHPSVMTRIRSLVTYRPANLPTRLLG